MMTHKPATVSSGYLYGAQTHWQSIRLDSPQWFAWLDAPGHDSLAYALVDPAKGYIAGWMTVRKERRPRGGAYWTAYRRRGHRVCKVYLGPTATLTEARLMAAAQRLQAPTATQAAPVAPAPAPPGAEPEGTSVTRQPLG
jgi:hypothetical protein